MATSSDNGARPEVEPSEAAEPGSTSAPPDEAPAAGEPGGEALDGPGASGDADGPLDAEPSAGKGANAPAETEEAAADAVASDPSATPSASGAPADPEAEALDEVRAMLGDDVRLPIELPRGYRPSESVREPLFRVELSDFAGPLDLLLYLIRKHAVDVLDIPIAFITKRYLGFLDELRALQIDVASEFLVLAAELTHIKSKMLLPAEEGIPVEDDEPIEEGDPRAELVRRLLEYQKYRDVALQLDDRDLLGRDVFPRVPPSAEAVDVDPGLKSVSIFKLVELMARMLRKAPVRSHEIAYETYSITERIDHVLEFGRAHGQRFTIGELLATVASRSELVVTFIAVLEMTKLGMVKLFIEEDRAAPPPASAPVEAQDAGAASADAGSAPDGTEASAPTEAAASTEAAESTDAAPEDERAALRDLADELDALADLEAAAAPPPADAVAPPPTDPDPVDAEPLPTIWIHLTGKTRDGDLVDDYRG